MVAYQTQAWVTSVLDDKEATKAIVLAGSLRRVLTTKKIVAVYNAGLSEKSRALLRDKFDLAVLVDETVPEGVYPLDFCKIFAFSLSLFQKCVYLSTSTLVLQNCDDLFEQSASFVAGVSPKKDVDTSVFLFTPTPRQYKAMKKIVQNVDAWKTNGKDAFSAYLGKWLINQEPQAATLDAKYNQKISLLDEINIYDGLQSDLGIVNFVDVHPFEVSDKILSGSVTSIGIVESFITDKWLTIFMEETRTQNLEEPSVNVTENSKPLSSEPIAIIGIACRYPGGVNSADEFWQLISEGGDGVHNLPNHRWTNDRALWQPTTRNVSAGFLDQRVDEFDAKFFGVSPKEAVFIDPQQRLLHEVTWEALEDAAVDPHSLYGSHTGIFVGSWLYDYRDIAVRHPDIDFFRVYMGNSVAAGAARLSYFLGTTGPSIATESGCSSAIAAVHMGCQSLRNGESNLAIACGVNLLLHPFDADVLSFVVAPDGRCKTFDAKANGFGRAEGCGVLLMKRYSEAVKDGDKIWGLIRGTALTQEGVSKSLGTPTIQCEALAMELALKDGGVDPKDVSFIETHGTGTPVGDPMEVAAIGKAYHSAARTQPLVIGSVKTNVGHTEATSGITGIIKVVLSMKNQLIPRHLHFTELNPDINLDIVPAIIPVEEIEWPRVAGKPRLAGVSSFGISGTDGHIIVQEAPDDLTPASTAVSKAVSTERPLHIMKLSAKTPESLEDLIKRHLSFLENGLSTINFADYSYTANVGRAAFNHRACLIAKDTEDAVKILKQNSFDRREIQSGNTGKLCFLFTGQGSQYPGMAAELYKSSPVFRMSLDKCNKLLQKLYKISIYDTLWSTDPKANAELSRTLYSQTSIFCVEYALLKLWESWGVKPEYVLGHSLGEFAAAVAVGALTLESALLLVAERSRLIDALPRGKMVVVRAGKTATQNILKEFLATNPGSWLDYAALNSSDQTVLAGDSVTVEKFAELCTERNTKTIILASSHAFHSRHMDPMLQEYSRVAIKVKAASDQNDCHYISGVEGKRIEKERLMAPDYWLRHTREKVSFIDACKAAHAENCTFFLEIGPHPVLSALAMANIDGTSVKCFPSLRRGKGDWTTILESAGKLFMSDWTGSINWKGLDEYMPRKKISVPFYPFQRKKIWVDAWAQPQKLHPLLGTPVRNASAISLFQNTLTIKQAPYLNDHVIGNTVVFPGAGFLEMLLAGGYSHVQGLYDEFILPRRSVLLRDFRIESPLGLDESKGVNLQVCVSLLEEKKQDGSPDLAAKSTATGYKAKVFHWHRAEDGGGHWISHASAMFSPLVTDDTVLNLANVNIPEIQEAWEKSTGSADLYKRLPEIGLRFGSTFQSLESGWRKLEVNGKDNAGLLVSVKVPEGAQKYIAHPVLVDAMIQGAMLWASTNNNAKERLSKKLQVPVSVQEFTWLRSSENASRFIHISKDCQDAIRITLVDGDGLPLMTMSGVEFVETSASVIESLLTSQADQIPNIWGEIWRQKPGPTDCFLQEADDENPIFSDDIRIRALQLNKLDEENSVVYHHLDKITVMQFMRGLFEMGWKSPPLRTSFSTDEVLASLQIKEQFAKWTGFFLKSLVKEGYLSLGKTKGTFTLVKSLPSKEELTTIIRQTVTDNEHTRVDYKLVYEVGAKLPDILRGKIPVLSLLFPEDTEIGNGPLDSFYEYTFNIISRPFDFLFYNILSRYEEGRKVGTYQAQQKIRILEVGAGLGVHTKKNLTILNEYGLQYTYYYTDISAAFFSKARVKLAEYEKDMVFQRFNIEEDPFAQGYCPGYFDIIIAGEVLHTTRNLRETLSNLRLLLKDNGYIQVVETTQQDRRLTFVFGLLEGYWRFQDFDLRPDHVCLYGHQWENLLDSCGFKKSIAVPCFEGVHSCVFAAARPGYYPNGIYRKVTHKPVETKPNWLVFGDEGNLCKGLIEKIESLERNVIFLSKDKCAEKVTGREYIEELVGKVEDKVKPLEGIIYLWGLVGEDENEVDQEKFLKPYLHLCQFLWEHQKMSPKTFVVTRSINPVEETSARLNPSPATLHGVTRSMRTETSLLMKVIDLPAEVIPDDFVEKVFHELWFNSDDEETVVFTGEFGDKRMTPRFVKLKVTTDNLSLPKGSDRFQLTLPSSRRIQDLEFTFLNFYTLGEKEIEIKVKAAALNFRDVFCVLKPIAQFEKLNAIGTDFAGVVCAVGSQVTKWKVGDAVFGCNMDDQQALPSHIKIREETVVPMPDSFTFAEAATLPAVFSTAFYCLVTVAKISKEDTILIHTASGGVGLSAIQIAQHFGAKIIATAGSERKRAYLRSLGIEHVFHSRNTDYGDQILEVTVGKGVSIVLNSLTGPGFKEASLKCAAKNARFVEMSKLSIWQPEEVKELRPDVDYSIVDLTTLGEASWRVLFEEMKKFVEGGVVKPIPYVRFDGVNIRAALTYLQKAKHIGKIVCVMPEIKLKDSQFFANTPLFNDRSTYMITGGITGGIGLETAKYMLSQGARYLVLVGRSEPNQKTQSLMGDWKEAGYQVKAWQADVGDWSRCQQLIAKIKDPANGLPPLRGIMHTAGVLSDGTIPNQSWDKFEQTFNSKVKGSWNLHHLTADCQLEHFVFFSSLAAVFGTPGQANHSAGNFFEDVLAHYRYSLGLSAATINWGNWGQVGVATEIEIPGFRPLSTQQGVSAIDFVLRTNRLQTGVYNVDSMAMFAKFCPRIKNYVDDRSLFAEIKGPVFNVNSDEFWNDVDGVEERDEKEEVFRRYIKTMIRSILKMEPDEVIDEHAEFATLGVDSLMMLEMKNSLQNLFGSRMTVTATDLKGCNTTHLLANKLVDILLSSAAAEEVLPTPEELSALLEEDCTLPSSVHASNPGVGLPSKVRSLLITGATGMFGPHILELVAQMPQITKIVCLIRSRGKTSGQDRLLATLEANGIQDKIPLEKIECVEGDVGQPLLGLKEEEYETLASSIDAIIHCAAKVDHLQAYRRTGPQEKFHTRTINAFGTRNVLEFASAHQTKLLLHVSTFAINYSFDDAKGCLKEDWEAPVVIPETIVYNNAYTISKYVAEQLVKQAAERGLPCKCFRLPFISGDTQSGRHDIRGNHTMLRFLTYLKLGLIPATPLPINHVPVDLCAKIVARLFFDDKTPWEVYNVNSRHLVLEQEFPRIAERFGCKVDIVETAEFLKKARALGDQLPIQAFMDLYEEDRMKGLLDSPVGPSMESFLKLENVEKYFYSEKLHKYCPDLYDQMESPIDVIARDLGYLKKTGIFEKFGL